MKIKILPKAKGNNRRYIVFDVETYGLGAYPENFKFAIVYDGRKFIEFYNVNSLKAYFENKQLKDCYVFAHNCEYDLMSIYGNIFANLDNKAIYSGSRFISATNGNVVFLDSLNIYPFSLKKIGAALGLNKMDISESLKNGLNTSVSNYEIEYCKRDCEILYKALENIFNVCGGVSYTIASLSLMFFRRFYLNSKIIYNKAYTDYFRNSYYGGRCECFKIGKFEKGLNVYDFNSMYPNAMKDCVFPDFLNLRYSENKSKFKFILEYYEGCCYVKVHHKDFKFGLLPYRYNNKLIFPLGTFEGWYNFNELRFAVKTGLVEILDVYCYIYGNKKDSIFKNFVNDVYEKRKNSNGIYNVIFKLILNSLYGKFAQKNNTERIYINDINEVDLFQYLSDKRFKKIYFFNQKRNDCIIEFENEKELLHSIVVISSYITSYARIELLKKLIQYKDNVYYCDTDSLFVDIELDENSHELGKLKKENKKVIEIRGLKNYVYIDENNEIKEAIKGVPSDAYRVSENVFYYNSIIKSKEALKNGYLNLTGRLEQRIKEVSLKYDKGLLTLYNDVKPIKF